jgi:hypothetical protein
MSPSQTLVINFCHGSLQSGQSFSPCVLQTKQLAGKTKDLIVSISTPGSYQT